MQDHSRQTNGSYAFHEDCLVLRESHSHLGWGQAPSSLGSHSGTQAGGSRRRTLLLLLLFRSSSTAASQAPC